MLVDERFRTTSVSEAEAFVGRVYQRPAIHESSGPLLMQQRMQGDERVNLTRFQISSVMVGTVNLDGVVTIGHLRSGEYYAESNGKPVDTSVPFLLQPGDAWSRSDDLDITMVNFDVVQLSRFAAARGYVPDGRLRFTRSAIASADTAKNWNRALAHVIDLFSDPMLFHNDLIRRGGVDLLCSAFLTAFVVDSSSEVAPSHGYPPALRRALQFIDENAAQPIDVAAIADAARMSVRGLQAAFRREFDTTPVDRLRTVRLTNAHADLVAASPSTDTVSAIARRWGFAHLSRFAALYRATYHQLPHQTLEA